MATRTFADLSSYRRAVDESKKTSDLLNSIIGGINQGVQLGQLPQTLQDQALARQLNNAVTQQKLIDLQNPEAALARQIERELTVKGALNPDLGILRAQPGLIGETIANPGALSAAQQALLPSTDLLALQDIALNQAGVPSNNVIPSAAPGLPETPVSAFGIQTGLNINPNIPTQAAEDKNTRQIQLANARLRSAGVQGQFMDDGFGGRIFVEKPTVSGGPVQSTQVITPSGEPVRVASKTTGSRGLTPNAQNALLKRYGAVSDLVGDIGDPSNIDFNQLAIEVGKAERSQDLADLKAKESGLSAAQKKDSAGFISAKKDLIGLKSKIQELQEDGREPGFWQNAFAAAASQPSTGWFSSIRRQLANAALNEDTIQKEALRSGLDSAVTKALSGLAVTSQEAIRLTPLIPQKDDTLSIILQKTAALEDFLNNRIGGSAETPASTPNNAAKIVIIAPDGTLGNWPANKAIPEGFKAQ